LGSAMPYAPEFRRFVDGACLVLGSENSIIVLITFPYLFQIASLRWSSSLQARLPDGRPRHI
jgi:hypothetical protein